MISSSFAFFEHTQYNQLMLILYLKWTYLMIFVVQTSYSLLVY